MFQTRGFAFRQTVIYTVRYGTVRYGTVRFTCVRKNSPTYKTANNDACKTYQSVLYIQSSSWRWTIGFETCRRHQKIKN